MLVTVITICYNEKTSIRETMDSILSQTFGDFSCVVKDGGSTDGTAEILMEYRERFLKRGIPFLLLTGRDGGIYDAMNQAAARAEGQWVNFMNAGDSFFSGDVLERVFEKEIPRDTDLLYGDTAEEEFGELHYFRKCPEKIRERMPFSHQSVFVRRELLLSHPFELKYKSGADYHFLLQLSREGRKFQDTGVLVAKVSKTGTSSVRLKDTWLESIEIRRANGIPQPDDREIRRQLRWISVKQFGMDYFPGWLKYFIRLVQRKLRGQKKI